MDNNYDELSTMFISDEISKCESIEEVKEIIFPMVKSQKNQWETKIKEILDRTGYTKTKFAKILGISRVALDKWLKGALPRNRETFLRIGMVADYSFDEINNLLQRYGRYPGLYSKSLEDCICMFVINHFKGEERIEKYTRTLNKIKNSIIMDENADPAELGTETFNIKLAEVNNESELEKFIADNIDVFVSAYNKLYAYVKMYVSQNYPGYAGSVNELADAQGWSSSLRQCVSAMRQKKWYPTRNKIISLGLHLNLERDQIDQMLDYAHMEPLCAKNIFESVIIFILEDASLNNLLDEDSEDYDPDALCKYSCEIMKTLDLPEIADFINELPESEDE
ncbi:MAG: hypothetical protein K6E85_14285 [Lachnospiraceae bacterium]|nr:hypothetical protein [Lachnospiraceae bacterium]